MWSVFAFVAAVVWTPAPTELDNKAATNYHQYVDDGGRWPHMRPLRQFVQKIKTNALVAFGVHCVGLVAIGCMLGAAECFYHWLHTGEDTCPLYAPDDIVNPFTVYLIDLTMEFIIEPVVTMVASVC